MALVSIVQRAHLEKTCRIDPAFYQPAYLESLKKLLKIKTTPLSKLAKVSDGNHLTIAEQFQDYPGVRYLRGQDLSTEMMIEDRNEVYIPEAVYHKIERAHIYPRDVLVTIVGANTGLIGLAYDIPEKLGASCKLGIARAHALNPGYLYAFLISKFGQHQIRRNKRGGGQTGLILPDMRNLLIARFPNLEDEIAKVALEGHEKIKQAKHVYIKVEQLLLSELGLQNWKPAPALAYTRNYSQAAHARRMDAEHFQPKFEELLQRITSTFDCKPLIRLVKFIEHGKQPPYVSDGNVFVFSQKYIGNQSIDYDFPNDTEVKKTSASFAEKFSQYVLCKNDILHYSVGGNIGFSQPYLTPETKAMPGSFITLIRADDGKVESLYLAIVLNSIVGRLQTDKWKSATAQPYIYPKDIKNFVIPLIAPTLQKEIARLVEQSYAARQEAKIILDKAKRAVEIAIEEGEEKAVALLNE